MRFGTDGYLWAGFGDGGFDEDDRGEAQNLGTINGKILRIDVNRRGPAAALRHPGRQPVRGAGGRAGRGLGGRLSQPLALALRSGRGRGVVGRRPRFGPARGDQPVVKGGNYGWNRLEGSLCLDARL